MLPLLVLSSCTDDRVELLVDLKTDFVPGAEFFLVETRIEARAGGGDQLSMFGALQGASVVEGLRVAELVGIARGEHVLTVTLRRADGEVLAERIVDLDLRGNFGVTVVMSRACTGVVCGDTESCAGGTCVARSCTPQTPETCPAPMCEMNTDCPGGVAACSAGACADGVCLAVESAGACAAGAFCQPDVGCIEYPDLPDAGTLDGGSMDGGVIPIAPVVVRPKRGEMVGSPRDTGNYSGTRPKLLWGGNGAVYQVELTPCAPADIGAGSCDFGDGRTVRFEEVESFHFEEIGTLVSALVPPEAVAWRVRGCHAAGGVGCGEWSESWFRVADEADLDGDGIAELVVGDRWRDEAGRPEGGVFVSLGSDPTNLILLGNPLDGLGGMGFAVTTGDLDGDGLAELIAGVPQHSDTNTHRGRALVYQGASSFTPSASFVILDDAQDLGHQWFGASLAYLGDVDGDGYGDLAVGAPGAHPPFDLTTTRTDPGEVYFYRGGPSFMSAPVALELLDRVNDPELAFGAAIVGCDMDSDGVLELVVGAPSSNPAKNGRADVFRYDSGAFTLVGRITPTEITSAGFGGTLACASDLDADGHNDLLVGDPLLPIGGTPEEGLVFVIFGDPSLAWTRWVELRASDSDAFAHFGRSILATDFDRDGVGEVVVGAPSFDLVSPDQGIVWLFESSDRWTSTTGPIGDVIAQGPALGFGSCLAAPGWRSGTNTVSLMVGAAGEQDSPLSGAYLTYERTDPGTGPELDISGRRSLVTRPPSQSGLLFGWSCR